MIRPISSLLGIVALAASISGASAATLANPGFETPISADGPPFVGFWEGFNSPNGTFSTTSDNPRSGAAHLTLTIIGDSEFAGAFQDVNVISGQDVTLSGWHFAADQLSMGIEVRIEWRDSVGDTEISRTQITPDPGAGSYLMFSLTDTVPAGADIARVVYGVQTFATGNGSTVYVDDLSLVVPEPSAAMLLFVGGLLALARRRR